MSPDLLEELRDADPARRAPAPAHPDWDAMAARITATRRRRRRRRALVLVPALATAAVAAVAVVVALQPAAETEVARPPAPAAPATGTIYHYVAVSEELAGPDRRSVPDTRGRREGWLDPDTGEKREVSADGSEQTTDAEGRVSFGQGPDRSAPVPAPAPDGEPRAATPPDGTVLTALVRPEQPLEDRGVTTLDGRRVRRFVFENAEKTLRQTYFVDAETGLPVLFRTETGDHLRTGAPIPDDQRLIEERFEVFEALPADADRAVLKPSG